MKYTTLLLFLFYCHFAIADSQAFQSSTISLSDNSKYAYVYFKKGTDIKFVVQNKKNQQISRDEFTEANYPKNGLYEVSTRKFRWSLNKKVESQRNFNVQPLNDGLHLVVKGPWASSIDDQAFSIYRRNRLIKEFKIKDFCLDQNKFIYSTSHFIWNHNFKINDANKTISFISCDKQFVIDVKTGKIQK